MAVAHNVDAGPLFFAGSIPDAVATAQRSSKIFLVYIGSDRDESTRLEEGTWRAPQVVSLLSEKFVVLRLVHGSVEAHHFSALYPISGVPSITAIGYQGLKIWEQNGFVTPEELVTKLKAAVETYNLQVQTAILSMPSAAAAPTRVETASPSMSQEAADKPDHTETTSEVDKNIPPEKSLPAGSQTESDAEDNAATSAAQDEQLQQSPRPESSCPRVGDLRACVRETTTSSAPELKSLKIPDKVSLQVKLTDGTVIRGEFEKSDSLWTVKSFVDDKRSDGQSQYAFAIPFPRKVFTAEDYEKPLVDLDIGYRAVLILVPSSDAKLVRSPSKPSSPTGGIGRWFSYLNPLSYVRGVSSPSSERPKSPPSPSVSSSADSVNKIPSITKRTSTSWGSNVHTLRHDDEEETFKRGNRYWNGNATQFGANDDDRK